MNSHHNHYLCTLIPSNLLPEQVEQAADSQALPTIVVTATNANAARGRSGAVCVGCGMSAPRNEREAYAELLRAWRIRRQHIEAERAEKAGHIVLCLWATVVIVLLAALFTA